MKNWPYSVMSHNAKEAGGPQAFCESLRQAGMAVGREQGRALGFEEGMTVGKASGRFEGLVVGAVTTLVFSGVLYVVGKNCEKKSGPTEVLAVATTEATEVEANDSVNSQQPQDLGDAGVNHSQTTSMDGEDANEEEPSSE